MKVLQSICRLNILRLFMQIIHAQNGVTCCLSFRERNFFVLKGKKSGLYELCLM